MKRNRFVLLAKRTIFLSILALGVGALSTLAITSVKAPQANANVVERAAGRALADGASQCISTGIRTCRDQCSGSQQQQCEHRVRDCCLHPGGQGCPQLL